MGGYKPIVIDKVRKALATYQWEKSHVMLKFSMYVGHSEFSVRKALYKLTELGEVEKIQEGRTRFNNYPRIIYRLTSCEPSKPQP